MRAKHALGYPEALINADGGSYDDALDRYLEGREPLPPAYGADRLERALTPSIGERILAEATNWIGTVEDPVNSNICAFTTWYYGVDEATMRQQWKAHLAKRSEPEPAGPWCAMFISYCANQIGSDFHYAYCPTILSHAQGGQNGLLITNQPRKGDLVLFQFDNDPQPDHVAIFEDWISRDTSFSTVEGNTSSDARGSQSNGGCVARRTRYPRNVIAFVRVWK
jgi:hypothetical protein